VVVDDAPPAVDAPAAQGGAHPHVYDVAGLQGAADVVKERAESKIVLCGDVHLVDVKADVAVVTVEPLTHVLFDSGAAARVQRGQHVECDHVVGGPGW